MKNSLLVMLCCLLAACSNQIGSDGSAELGSLSNDVTYHDRQDGMLTTNGESLSLYNKIFLKADGSQFTYQSVKIVNGVPTKCEMSGSWDVEGGDTTTSRENELVATVTGGTVSPKTVRFPLRQLDNMTLRLQLGQTDSMIVDLTNQSWTPLEVPDVSSAGTSTDCDWQ
ncbi:hypothetical protein B9G69_003020 [Bdellovibrio sp. SKB1291214]|uniref:hypothetical protein n=1 Tax=Bdellovibrio sp. SKB1291214 TaxID=1732569 RepID=UPI000B51BD29|nr:hypothetical protein [Bdellovibrio sp. SKB1291214]UYL09542.1 hypothetical protein B9G69_003020 [Bdellovibrio sp. SKB1291214]